MGSVLEMYNDTFFFLTRFCLQVNSVDLDPTNTLVVTGTMDGKTLYHNLDQKPLVYPGYL